MTTNTSTRAADYYVGGQHEHAHVVIYTIFGGRRCTIRRIDVSGKREARTVVAEYGATPWNF